MRAKRNRRAEAERSRVFGDMSSLPARPATGEEMPPTTAVLRTFPAGHRHPRGVVLVCPVCDAHHWLAFAADALYRCPLDGDMFVADGGAA